MMFFRFCVFAVLFSLGCGSFSSLSGADTLKLQQSDFVLINGVQHRYKTAVDCKDGLFSVQIDPQKQISNGTRGAELKLPLDKIRGKNIILRAKMRGIGIDSNVDANHVGGKILAVVTAGGKTRYIGSQTVIGDTDFQDVYVVCPIPANAEKASFTFGLQQAWGRLEFKEPVCEFDAPAGVVLKPRSLPLIASENKVGSAYNFILFGDTHFDREPEVYHSKFSYSKNTSFAQTQKREFMRYADMWKNRSPRMLAAAGKVCEKSASAFVVQLGDLVQGDCSSSAEQTGMLNEALSIFQNSFPGKKFLTVCGNHDVRGVGAVKAYRKVMPAYHSKVLGKEIKKTTFAYRHGEDLYAFVDFNNVDVPELKKILQENQNARYKFILIHAPVLPADHPLAHWFYLGDSNRERSEMRELLLKNDVIVLAGHTHTFELLECQTDSGRITQLITGGVWTSEGLKKPVIHYTKPADYGKILQKNPAKYKNGIRLISEVSPAVTRYFRGEGTGFSRIEVTPEGVTAYFYGGDAVTPTQTIKLR